MQYEVLTIQASGGPDDIVSLRQEPNRIERLLGSREKRLTFYGHDDLWHTVDGVPPRHRLRNLLRTVWQEHSQELR